MQIKFYLDEDSSDAELVSAARMRGIDVLTTNEAGNRGKSDTEQLEYSTEAGRVLLSCNVSDFARLHKEFISKDKHHSGILLAKQRGFGIGEQVRRMINLSNNKTAEEMINEIEFLSSWG